MKKQTALENFLPVLIVFSVAIQTIYDCQYDPYTCPNLLAEKLYEFDDFSNYNPIYPTTFSPHATLSTIGTPVSTVDNYVYVSPSAAPDGTN